MPTKAYWFMSSNFGDNLTPWLIEKITGKWPIYTEPERDPDCVIVCGSIANHAKDGTVVWGAGLGSFAHTVEAKARFKAVRGPLTLDRVVACGHGYPIALGDPALLLPRFYQPKVTTRHPVGLVPHFRDESFMWAAQPNAHIISPLLPIERFVDEICSCDRIVSTALHALIVADAYGVPNCWATMGNRLDGDGIKFHDYQLSVGREIKKPQKLEGSTVPKNLPVNKPIQITLADGLMESCPFRS